MLPGLTLPASLAVLLETFRSCFTAPSFGTFQALVAGLVAQTGRRTVCGMLLGAGLSRLLPHDRFHRFFSHARWSPDQLGLAAARLIVTRLLPAAAEVEVAVDDSLFRRRGRSVHGAFWAHDGSQPGHVTARGNRWVICGILVRLPFSSRRWCLPVLFRLWAGKGTASPVALASQMLGLLAAAFPDRVIHLVADAAYHGKPLADLPARLTVTTRLPRNAVLYALAPSRTGRRGRPATKGARLGTPGEVAARATWRRTVVTRRRPPQIRA
jgi:hypothetical protein